jgi:hypothetical protein
LTFLKPTKENDMLQRHRTGLAALALTLMIAGGALAQSGAQDLTIDFANLMPLDEAVDGVYEGWAIIGGAPVSTGVFNVNASGQTVEPGTGNVIGYFATGVDLGEATDIKISLEPVGDSDPGPSGLIVLEGMIDGDTAQLQAALPGLDMLPGAMAHYILATPSDNDVDTMNDDQGVWYLSMPGPVAGLTGLPDLGAGWVYEGWAVDVSGSSPMPYSTGTFTMGEGADSDMAGCNGGGPGFPGQDFTAFHCGPVLDLDSGDFDLVISIEPVPDNNPAPFQFKPLAGMVPTDGVGMAHSLSNQTGDTFPTGVATLSGVTPVTSSTLGGLKAIFR